MESVQHGRPSAVMNVPEQIKAFRRRMIVYALKKHHGNIRAAAREIGFTPGAMERWVRILELNDAARELRRGRAWTSISSLALVCAFVFTISFPVSTMNEEATHEQFFSSRIAFCQMVSWTSRARGHAEHLFGRVNHNGGIHVC